MILLGLSGFIAGMMVHAVTLPIEFDASFAKALPVLREGSYVSNGRRCSEPHFKGGSSDICVCGVTDILNLGRWIAILLRR